MATISTVSAPGEQTPSLWVTTLLAVSCGLLAANLYYAQPIAGLMSAALGFPRDATGLIVTLTQIGYGAGLLFIVPLSDLLENRRLSLSMLVVCGLALLAVALSSNATTFAVAALFLGLGSVVVQILVPYAAHMAPEAMRGRIVGNVMSGLMMGVMLARPISSFITDISSWRVVFFMAAGITLALAVVLRQALPPRAPTSRLSYGQLLATMGSLATTTPILRRRALYQACLGAAFSLFWTTAPLLLAGNAFQLSQGGIALFGLAGVAGAIAAPIAGRVADRGWTRPATSLAILSVVIAFMITRIAAPGSFPALALLVAAAILIDLGVTANMALGQRAIFTLAPELRGRLNGLFVAIFFAGCALGSALGGWSYYRGGWPLASWVGIVPPVAALLYLMTE